MQNPSVIRTRPRRTSTATPARTLPLTFILLVIVCACVVGTGFFLAARQHFTSMDYGIKNSRLRDQLQNLEAEKRRLLLAREVALSPISVRKAARGIGLRENSESAQTIAVPAKSAPAKNRVEDLHLIKAATREEKRVTANPFVRTVLTAPVNVKDSGETRTRVVDSSKVRKDRNEVAALVKFR
ncbi:MAG TPA: hypothetical protein VFZ23_16995 [Pyrinomonadaceae bacterium]